MRGAATEAAQRMVATLRRAVRRTIHTHKIQPFSSSTLANVAASSVPGLAKSLLSIPAESRSAA
jgi:tRNA A37 threonylcarbamoyltransferase TsaD